MENKEWEIIFTGRDKLDPIIIREKSGRYVCELRPRCDPNDDLACEYYLNVANRIIKNEDENKLLRSALNSVKVFFDEDFPEGPYDRNVCATTTYRAAYIKVLDALKIVHREADDGK